MDCLPIIGEDYPANYISALEIMMAKMKTCDALVHIAGFYYGKELLLQPPEDERRSLVQMEYEIAMELGLPCCVLLCGENYIFDEHDADPKEKRELQLAHRERLRSHDGTCHEIDTWADLESRLGELQPSVDALREKLENEHKRRRMMMVISAVVLLVAVIGGVMLSNKESAVGIRSI